MLRLVVVLLLFDPIFSQTTNYCDPKLCSAGVQHVACNNTGVIARTCVLGQIVLIKQKHIDLILKIHNGYRSQLANGLISGLAQAARMPQLIWSTELAKLAELSVRRCEAGDRCRNTAKFRYVGQNAISLNKYGYWVSTEFIKGNFNWIFELNRWFSQKSNTNQSDVDVIKVRAANLPIITHFTNMINDKVTEVGCAALAYHHYGMEFNVAIVCNYNYANIVGKPVYLKGTKCSKCTKGCSKVYPGLCNVGEIVN